MGLSEREQRLLEEMERRLYASEADSVQAGSGISSRPSYRAIVFAVLSIVAGVLALVVAVAASQLWVGVIGFLIMLAGLLYASSPKNQITQDSQSVQAPRQSLSEKLEKRWEQRMDGDI